MSDQPGSQQQQQFGLFGDDLNKPNQAEAQATASGQSQGSGPLNEPPPPYPGVPTNPQPPPPGFSYPPQATGYPPAGGYPPQVGPDSVVVHHHHPAGGAAVEGGVATGQPTTVVMVKQGNCPSCQVGIWSFENRPWDTMVCWNIIRPINNVFASGTWSYVLFTVENLTPKWRTFLNSRALVGWNRTIWVYSTENKLLVSISPLRTQSSPLLLLLLLLLLFRSAFPNILKWK